MVRQNSKSGYRPDICPSCKQSCTYLIEFNENLAQLMIRLSMLVEMKGINTFNPSQELAGARFSSGTPISSAYLTQARHFNLIAKDRRNYKLTNLGTAFLRGEPVPRYAVISKAERHQVGYFEPDKLIRRINDFSAFGAWSGMKFDIINDNVVRHQPALI